MYFKLDVFEQLLFIVKLSAIKGEASRKGKYLFQINQKLGYFLHDKIIAPVHLSGMRSLPPGRSGFKLPSSANFDAFFRGLLF
jgi:hypothetical protein